MTEDPAAPPEGGPPDPPAPAGTGRLLRRLLGHSAVYGSADVVSNAVNFLLIPLYVAYLSREDYGVIALLLLFGTMAKIVFRLGLDAGFFRIHYELETEAERRTLAGTVALFAAGAGTLLFALLALSSSWGARALLGPGVPGGRTLLLLVASDVYLGTYAFVPLNLLRIQGRPGLFSTLTASRNALNTVLKVVLLTHGMGVRGVVLSDALATAGLSLVLLPVLWRHAALRFSPKLLGEALGFGLPKVPHGILVQALNLADRKILDLFVSLGEVGVYQMAYTFGMGVKFALSAFEPAWQPFLYGHVGEKDAPRTLSRIVTWVFAGFCLLGLAFAVPSRELLTLMTATNPQFQAAAPIIPVVTLAYVLQGVFLLTSVGIGISKRARYYPIVTAAAAGANIALNFAWIPRYGVLGAAWATVAGYAVMALLGFVFGQRLYPLPLQWGRLLRVVLASGTVFWLSTFVHAGLWVALVLKAALVLAFPLLLFALGFRPEAGALPGGRPGGGWGRSRETA